MSKRGIESKGPQQLDDDSREKLMALGYVGGFTSRAKLSQKGTLGDPKDKIILFNKIKMAEGASSDREYDKALSLLEQVIKDDPGIMEARQVRANIYLQLDRAKDAAEECKEALKVDPDYNAAIFTLAEAYKKLGKYEEAIAGFERASQLDPRDAKPHVNMGEIFLETKDFDKAIAQFENAITIDPEHSSLAHNDLGAALLEKRCSSGPRKNSLRLWR